MRQRRIRGFASGGVGGLGRGQRRERGRAGPAACSASAPDATNRRCHQSARRRPRRACGPVVPSRASLTCAVSSRYAACRQLTEEAHQPTRHLRRTWHRTSNHLAGTAAADGAATPTNCAVGTRAASGRNRSHRHLCVQGGQYPLRPGFVWLGECHVVHCVACTHGHATGKSPY